MLTEAAQTVVFRIAVGFSLAFATAALALFAFIYWQTAGLETYRVDRYIEQQAATLARARPEEIMWAVRSHLAEDLHRVSFIALFDANKHLIAGNLLEVPPRLVFDGFAHPVEVKWQADGNDRDERVRAVGNVLPDGRLLLVGRTVEELANLRAVVVRALDIGVIPAIFLSLAGGVYFSLRGVQRARVVYRALERIMDGHLEERLPARPRGDDFDRLSISVNRVLDELQRLLNEVKGVGDDIAHDLRAPLARVRARLERVRGSGKSIDEFHAAIDQAISALDQVFGVITALLRIGEIDSRQRRTGFGLLTLDDLVREVGELYEPIAESRNIRFVINLTGAAIDRPGIKGDRELLIEALINLVDNAVKYTPSGGLVDLSVVPGAQGDIIRVRDTGIGIAAKERGTIMRPYYRTQEAMGVPGSGVGLSLVSAIMRLHNFTLVVRDGQPGTVFEMHCYDPRTPAKDGIVLQRASMIPQ